MLFIWLKALLLVQFLCVGSSRIMIIDKIWQKFHLLQFDLMLTSVEKWQLLPLGDIFTMCSLSMILLQRCGFTSFERRPNLIGTLENGIKLYNKSFLKWWSYSTSTDELLVEFLGMHWAWHSTPTHCHLHDTTKLRLLPLKWDYCWDDTVDVEGSSIAWPVLKWWTGQGDSRPQSKVHSGPRCY